MRPSSLAYLLSIPALALAQSSGGQSGGNVHLSTTVITSTTFSDRQQLTFLSTQVVTVTDAPAPSGSGSSNSSALPSGSGNSTRSGSDSVSKTSTTASNLPTAATDVNGGGQGGAPTPGQTAAGGIYGPDDSYTAGALMLHTNVIAVSLGGLLIGGALLAL